MVRTIHSQELVYRMERYMFGMPTDYKEELDHIIKLVKILRSKKNGKHTHWEEAAEWHMKYSNLHGKPELALTITLSPTGCDWARQGGCTMCGEFEGSFKRDDLLNNPQFHISQFVSAITNPKVWEKSKEVNAPISWLRINQEGSFTNPNEVNIDAQKNILRLATRIKGIKRITIESRPQYLTEDIVAFLDNIFNDTGVELEIGMGVEAQDDVIRNICINKQGSKTEFVNAVKLLNDHEIKPLAYILLKPPFLTEQEAIDEAVKTAHFAAEIGFERISFEPLSIHQYTLVDLLRRAGYYTPPWLWSVIEVAKQCSDISEIFGIGGVGYYPIPVEYAQNRYDEHICEECLGKAINAIMEYNRTRDVSVFNSLTCKCIEQWKSECSIDGIPLKYRIIKQLEAVDKIVDEYLPALLDTESPVRNMRIIYGNSQN